MTWWASPPDVRAELVDEVSIRVLDVTSGVAHPDVLPPARYGEVALTPDATASCPT